MILANSTWGKLLGEREIPGIYRAQSGGKVRMTTVASPHDGLGVDCYAWSSSPLRRYVDLVNQWQLIAALRGDEPPFAPARPSSWRPSATSTMTYAAYAEFQRQMGATGACGGCGRTVSNRSPPVSCATTWFVSRMRPSSSGPFDADATARQPGKAGGRGLGPHGH